MPSPNDDNSFTLSWKLAGENSPSPPKRRSYRAAPNGQAGTDPRSASTEVNAASLWDMLDAPPEATGEMI